MSTTVMTVGEHDVVTLRNSVEGFPPGTRGAVVSMFPTHRWVEVVDDSDEWGFRIISVPTEELELVWRCPTSDSTTDAD